MTSMAPLSLLQPAKTSTPQSLRLVVQAAVVDCSHRSAACRIWPRSCEPWLPLGGAGNAAPGRTVSEQLAVEAEEAKAAGDGVWEGDKARASRLGAERRAVAALSEPSLPPLRHRIEDLYHVLVTCTEASTAAARAVFTTGLPERLVHLLSLVVFLRHGVDRLTYSRNLGELSRREALMSCLEQLAREVDWASADGKFVLFH